MLPRRERNLVEMTLEKIPHGQHLARFFFRNAPLDWGVNAGYSLNQATRELKFDILTKVDGTLADLRFEGDH